MKALRIKKSELVVLARWLNKQQLAGKQSRIRTRFVRDLADAMRQLEQERQAIIGSYVEKKKTKKGEEWKTTVDNGVKVWKVSPEKREALNKELADLYAEDWVMDCTPETEEKLLTIKDILESTEYIFGPAPDDEPETAQQKIQEANSYEVWCRAFEALD